jgi:glycosyltransferase involved in cell wall biosynthesis
METAAPATAPETESAPTTVAAPSAPHVVYHSALLDLSGYAQVARLMLRELDRGGARVRAYPIWGAMRRVEAGENPPGAVVLELPDPAGGIVRYRSDLGERETREIVALHERRDVRNDLVIAHHVPGAPDGRDFFDEMRSRHPGAWRAIGSTMFETDRIPDCWKAPCERVDELWVPTRFNLDTFSAAGVDRAKIRVMPFGVPALGPGDVDRSYAVHSSRAFKFLSVFELTKRKGWDVLLRAWVEAFDPDDDVALVIKTYGRKGVKPAEVFADYLRSIGRDPERIPEIVLIEDRLTDAQMRGLYPQCDAFVLPSRGEGWGMPYLEAQQHGLPVVATRWSGQLEFLNDDNAFLIGLDGLTEVDAEQVRDDPIYAGHRWAEPSVAETVEALRRVHGDAEERRRRASRGAEDARTVWTAERAAARMRARLDELERARVATLRACAADLTTPAVAVWRGPIESPSGYGSEARAFVKALDATGYPIATRPVAWGRATVRLPDADRDRLHALARRAVRRDAVVVQHSFAEHFQRGAERVAVVRTMFETDRLPDGWAAALERVEGVWVPSRHNLTTFAAGGVPRAKLALLPGTADMDAFAPLGPQERLAPDGVFVFLSVFEWSLRKAPDLLFRAYAELFSGRDDVLLALRIAPPTGRTSSEVAEAVARTLARFAPGGVAPPFRLLDERAEDALPALYRGADAFVLPSRGEGFGRPYLEAAAVGLPVVATRWSGHLDFLDDRISYLVDAPLVDVPARAAAELPRFKGHRWAEPDFAQLKAKMREVFEDRRGAKEKGRRAAASVRRTHAPAVVAKTLRALLDGFGAAQ